MKYITNILLVIAAVLLFQNCSHEDSFIYETGEQYLFFERYKRISKTERVRIDTVFYSFTDYIGKTEITHFFKVGLIGDILAEDTEYKIIVVDSLTTAKPEQYNLPEHPIFHKGSAVDSLEVTIYKAPLENEEVVLTLRLVENTNFGLGYNGYLDARIRFNDDDSKPPKWWNREVELAYLGVFSRTKLNTIKAANPDFTGFDGLNATQKRKIALNTKAYIAEHNVIDEDDKPMFIPMY